MPSGAAAKLGSVDSLAAQQCAQERQNIGRKAFAKKYGRAGMRVCIRRTRATIVAATNQANQDCQAELAQIGQAAFNDEYGSDPSGTDAFDECVAEDVDSILNPDNGSGATVAAS